MKLTEKEKQTIKIARDIATFDGGQFEASDLRIMIDVLLARYLRLKVQKYITVETDSDNFPIKITVSKIKL